MVDNSDIIRIYTSQNRTVFREYNNGKKTLQKAGEKEKSVLDFVYLSDKKRVELKDELSKIKPSGRKKNVLEELIAKGRREEYKEHHGKIFYAVYEISGDEENYRRGCGWSSEIAKIEPGFS